MDRIDDLLLPLRAVAQLGDEIDQHAAMAVAGLERSHDDGDEFVMPAYVTEHARIVFDRAARLARWLPMLPLPSQSKEVPHDRYPE